jgi:hypothetical protein
VPLTREELDGRVLAMIASGAQAPPDDARFEALALELFRFQHAANAPYRRICAALGVEPEAVRRWRDIPAVPTGAFKEARLACFPPERTIRVFRSSGSTTERRSELHLDTLALYEASVRATFGAWLVPEGRRLRFLVLAPSEDDAPDSSLSSMFAIAMRAFGTAESRFLVRGDGWDPGAAIDALRGAGAPALVAGTAFAFVHLLDAMDERRARIVLPAGTRVMETGGFKGRSRELSRDELHAALARAFGIPRTSVVNQYGMSELGSQFYEATLVEGGGSATKRVPPWVRTRAVDPETLDDVAPGQVGALVHYDLANTGSVLAVMTSDAGRLVAGGFEVLGRLAGAEARGCSIAADALLGTP